MTDFTAFPIFDGHNDVLLDLHLAERGAGRSFFTESDRGHLDLPRARRGGFGGGFFAIFPPAPPPEEPMLGRLVRHEDGYEVLPYPALDPAYAQQITISVAARLFRLEAESAGQLCVVRNVAELQRCLEDGTLAAILHFEGAEAIDPQLDALEVFYQAGLRSLGIVWSRPNAFGHGVPFKFPSSPDTGPGLTDAGKALVKACNRLGILLDLAHLNEQGFWDVARLSEAPLVVTHAAAHALCPSTRNLTDAQLEAIKASDGMVGLIFETANLRADAAEEPDTSLDVLLAHLEYLVEHVGIERVGFGSDFDGGITPPRDLHDVSGLPTLLAALRARGYDDDALRKITHENWLRVLGKTWRA
ncbi:MAG TPA: dipeptidase [Ktedonobacterales bacterium]|nr:dipeptidase [Ktedonobacterales bacterium]